MGHFSYTCGLSGLPITSGTPSVLIVMKMKDKLFDNSEQNLRKYGKTCLVSNDSTQMKFQPVWFPIHADYDDYGGMESIRKDDNTELLEKFYGLPIETIIDVVTSGRKDDGYDDVLKAVKKPFNLPDDMVEGEDWFARYQRLENDPKPCSSPDLSGLYREGWKEEGYEGWTVWRDGKKVKATKEEYDADFKLIHEQYARYKKWLEVNPDPTDDYDNPQYEERFKELLSYSGMWVHGKFYEELTKKAVNDSYNCTSIDLGTPEILEELGFKEISQDKVEKRYKRRFQKGKLIVNSDSTWLHAADNRGIYSLHEFRKYCQEHGVDIDITKMNKKDSVEQMYDYIIPNVDAIGRDAFDWKWELMDKFEELSKEEQKGEKGQQMLLEAKKRMEYEPHPMDRTLKYRFLNPNEYGYKNPMMDVYFEAAKQGKIRENLVRFWRFDYYMYCTGRYYDVVGTSPQDGSREGVMTMLKAASKVLRAELKERNQWDNE